MEQFDSCWMKEFKDAKDRPMTCSGCELHYHWNEFISSIIESPFFRLVLSVFNINRKDKS
jgi:hypothetical protein